MPKNAGELLDAGYHCSEAMLLGVGGLLRVFEQEGLISMQRQRIVLKNREGLEKAGQA